MPVWYVTLYTSYPIPISYCVVVCAIISDCATVPGLISCKEITEGGPGLCSHADTCLADCAEEEYCGMDDTCYQPGTVYAIYYVVTCYAVSEPCQSTADCDGVSVCKQTVYGGQKTCQPETACKISCSDQQFCDPSNICRWSIGKLSCILIIIGQTDRHIQAHTDERQRDRRQTEK